MKLFGMTYSQSGTRDTGPAPGWKKSASDFQLYSVIENGLRLMLVIYVIIMTQVH
jgi:hypothetical protein